MVQRPRGLLAARMCLVEDDTVSVVKFNKRPRLEEGDLIEFDDNQWEVIVAYSPKYLAKESNNFADFTDDDYVSYLNVCSGSILVIYDPNYDGGE
mgnify:CR=1 FL=1